MAEPTQLDRIEAALQTIKLQNTQQTALLSSLIAGDQLMSAQLDALTAEVTETTTVQQSAINLLNNLGQTIAQIQAELAAIGITNAALDQLSNTLSTNTDQLAAAVVANTPAANSPQNPT